MANKYILAAGAWEQSPQFSNLHRAEQRIAATHNPDAKKPPDVWQVCGDLALSAKYSRANGIANDYGKPEAETEYA